MIKTLKYYFFLSLLSMLFFACNSRTVYEESMTVKESVWNWQQKAQFEFDIKDTATPNNIFINIRNTNKYKFSNLYLFVTLTAPDGNFMKDTFNCVLADEKGNWLGKGSGDIRENHVIWKKDVVFPQSGKYTIDIVQAMREKKLEGITDVGIDIEKVF